MLERIKANLGPDFNSTRNSVVNGAKLGTLVGVILILIALISK